jgi:hypothetical protein
LLFADFLALGTNFPRSPHSQYPRRLVDCGFVLTFKQLNYEYKAKVETGVQHFIEKNLDLLVRHLVVMVDAVEMYTYFRLLI